MVNGINHSFAIADKLITRYGRTWASIDFYPSSLNLALYKNDPMHYIVGHLQLDNIQIKMSMKDLYKLESSLQEIYEVNNKIKDKTYQTDIRIGSYNFALVKHEISRLYETILDAKLTVNRLYELGR